MTKIIAPLFLALAAACGGGTDNETNHGPDGGGGAEGLACNAVSYCSTWTANSADVTPPVDRGGTISDGIYRLERGTSSVKLLQFAGNRVNSISDSFDNDTGTYTTSNGTISFSYTKSCDKMGTTDNAYSWNNRPYYVASADTLLIGMADSNGGAVAWYEYKKVPLDQICTSNANVKCNVSNCSCAVVTNGFGTITGGAAQCSST